MIEKIQLDGSTLMDITTRTWHQCPTLVRNYIANVTYDPSDYTTTQIATYAPATAVSSNTKPIGNTVNGTTYYNEEPNVAAPIVSGAVKPLDSLRWLNTTVGTSEMGVNVRDLGGWTCDGGTVKYGMLVRGGNTNTVDKDLMVNQVGIKHELDLRGDGADGYSKWGIQYTAPSVYAWYTLTPIAAWKATLRCIFDNVNKGVPVYFHCSAGCDRTGTLACVLEALLGMSQSDIDKDYELSSFFQGTIDAAHTRARNETEWIGLINAIKAVTLEGGLSDTFRNRAVSFVLSLGFTIDEINAFRTAMIDGTPDTITVSMDSYTVTKSGTNISFDNSASSVDEFQGYEVNLTPASGYAINSVIVTIGGTNITDSVLSGTETNINRSVGNTLTNCASSNSKTWCINGQGYVEDISANTEYEFDGVDDVTVTMGGTDITSSAVIYIE